MSTTEPDMPESATPPERPDAGRARTRRRVGWTTATVLVLAAAGGTYALASAGGTTHRVTTTSSTPGSSGSAVPSPSTSSTPSAPLTTYTPTPGAANTQMIVPRPPATAPSSSPMAGGVVLPVTSYAASSDGRTLWLSEQGLITSGCTHYTAVARPSGSTVLVGLLRTTKARTGAMCPMYATVTKPLPVKLSIPLGDRRVVSLVTNKTPQRTALASTPGVVPPTR